MYIILLSLAVSVVAVALFIEESWIIISLCGIAIGLSIGVPAAIVTFLVSRVVNKNRRKIIRFIGIFVSCMVIIFLVKAPSPEKLFKRIIADPIPESVDNLRSYYHWVSFEPSYMLKFSISQDDLHEILNINSFKRESGFALNDENLIASFTEIPPAYYAPQNEVISWHDTGAASEISEIPEYWMILFGPAGYLSRKKPSWWNLAELENPVLYIAPTEDGSRRYLIYDDTKRLAYFFKDYF